MEKLNDIDMTARAFGRRMAEIRSARGVTQEALADSLGTSPKYLQHLEAGRANPALRLVIRIAVALGVPPAELFKPPESMEPPRTGRPPRKQIPS